MNPDLFMSFQMLEHLNSPIEFLKSLSKNSKCNYFLITVPFLAKSRVGLEHIRGKLSENVRAENIHVFEYLRRSFYKKGHLNSINFSNIYIYMNQ